MNEEIKRKRIMVVDDESDLTLFYRMSLGTLDLKLKHLMTPRCFIKFQNSLL